MKEMIEKKEMEEKQNMKKSKELALHDNENKKSNVQNLQLSDNHENKEN